MNGLAEMPTPSYTARPAVRPRTEGASGAGYTYGLLAALGIHAAILFFVPKAAPVIVQAEFGVDVADASVEVSLVAAPPAEEPEPVVETPPEPVPPTPPEPEPEPVPESPPVVPEVKAEMTLPEPEPTPVPAPVPIQREKPKVQAKPVQKPKPVAKPVRVVGDGSSSVPGNDATTAKAASGAASTKPGYLRNPHPPYPAAARAAKQQGSVSLNVSIDAQGNVTKVRLAGSSGFPLLDESAVSTVSSSWKFRPATANGVAFSDTLTFSIRFTLDR